MSTISSTKCSTKLIYIHGFNSSPKSPKAIAVKDCLRAKFADIEILAPQLPYYPKESLETLEAILEDTLKTQKIRIIASSMGCFFTNYLSQFYPVRACFVNPAVEPFDRVAEYLYQDILHPYTGESFHLTGQHLEELKSLRSNTTHPKSNFWVFLKEGDEVLDYMLAKKIYKDHKLHIDKGGDHSFSDFEDYVEQMIRWLYLEDDLSGL